MKYCFLLFFFCFFQKSTRNLKKNFILKNVVFRGLLSDFLSQKIVFFLRHFPSFFLSKKSFFFFADFSLICFSQKIVVFRGIFPHNPSSLHCVLFVVSFQNIVFEDFAFYLKEKIYTDLFLWVDQNENQNRPLWRNFTSKTIHIGQKIDVFAAFFDRN